LGNVLIDGALLQKKPVLPGEDQHVHDPVEEAGVAVYLRARGKREHPARFVHDLKEFLVHGVMIIPQREGRTKQRRNFDNSSLGA
jgi:hypothetical protein